MCQKKLESKIEELRQEMYSTSSKQERLKISQKLDKLIFKHLKLTHD